MCRRIDFADVVMVTIIMITLLVKSVAEMGTVCIAMWYNARVPSFATFAATMIPLHCQNYH